MRCVVFALKLVDLDHMAPLAYILKLPLITTNATVYALCKEYYPQVKPQYIDLELFSFDSIANDYDVILHTFKPWAMRLIHFGRLVCTKRLYSVYCPHGNSDKLFTYTQSDKVINHDIQLIYGEQMRSYINEYSVCEKHPLIPVGNYRNAFYKRYKAHFDAIAKKHIFDKFEKKQKTILYAPTWNDPEANSSFLDQFADLPHNLPPHYNLIFKIHPNLEMRQHAQVHSLIETCKAMPNVVTTHTFTPIYPLLERSDIYLGDHSSVGYDFLTVRKPQFFLRGNKSKPLHKCGHLINDKNPFPFIEAHPENNYRKEQDALYEHVFEDHVSFDALRTTFFDALENWKVPC